MTSASPIVERPLEVGTATVPRLVVRNTGTAVLYPRLILSGLPPVGRETAASNGLSLEVQYLTPDDKPLDPTRLVQGTDFKAVVKVTNSGARGDYRSWRCRRLSPRAGRSATTASTRAASGPRRRSTYQDVRDDRVYTYFDLKAGETKTVEVAINASYLGRFYLPLLTVEAMYDATLNARAKGPVGRGGDAGRVA